MRLHAQGRQAIVIAAALVVLGIGLAGQGGTPAPEDPPTGSGLLVGQVVDAVTGKPVAGVFLSCGGGPGAGFSYSTNPNGLPAINGPGRSQSPTGAPRQVLSDNEGRFVFRDLPPGNYVVRVPAAPGYLVGGYGQNRPNGPVRPITLAKDDSKVGNLTIRLWRTATLGGTVVDESGEPLVGMTVAALRRTVVNGVVRLASVTQSDTDDRGAYRVAGLGPGDYLVAVMSSVTTLPSAAAEAYAQAITSGGPAQNNDAYRALSASGVDIFFGGGFRVGDLIVSGNRFGNGPTPPPPAEDGDFLVYPTTFHPSVRTASQASVVTLGPGDDRSGVDLQLRPVETHRVSGTVIGPEGPMPNTGVKLASPDSENVTGFLSTTNEPASTATDGSGAFTFLGVPSGQYTLKVFRVPRPIPTNTMPANLTRIEVSGPGGGMMIGMSSVGPGAAPAPPPPIPEEPTLSASMPIAVSDSDLKNVSVVLRAGPHLSGKVQFDGSRQPPDATQMQRIFISIQSQEARPYQASPVTRVEADGRFATGGIVPGKYLISANVPPPTPGVPVAPGTGWTLKGAMLNGRNLTDEPLEVGDEDIAGIVISFSDRSTDLTGTVSSPNPEAAKNAEVVALPADSDSWRQGTSSTRRVRIAPASPDGVYRFAGLPPGDYLLTALSGDTPIDLLDPKFLEGVAGAGTRVTIADGDKRTLDLQVKAVRR